jgi:hypothetical protein
MLPDTTARQPVSAGRLDPICLILVIILLAIYFI